MPARTASTASTASTARTARTATGDLPLLDLPGVAERLNVNQRHVRRLVAERRIPFLKWGHLLRFDPAEIEAWLDRARRS